MIMSTLIQQSENKVKTPNITFLQRLKSIVHDQLKKSTIIYTTTNESATFHYYTILDPNKSQYIELYWVIDYLPHLVSINVNYTTYRTLSMPIMINDLRNRIQVNFLLKLLNKNAPYFLTFLLNERNEVCINFSRSIFHESDRTFLLKSIKSIVSQLLQKATEEFQSLISYLNIPIEICTRSFTAQKNNLSESESEEFNLIKLKNTFDRFRKNRQRTADLIYEETDILKMRKKIQGYTKIMGSQLRALQNLKFTTKQIQRQKLIEQINSNNIPSILTKVDRIAYQFQIISVVEPQKKTEINANSQIYFGEYSFRIFKTLIDDEKITKISKSQPIKKTNELMFEEKDVIEERKCCLVKKKAMNKASGRALRNQTSFLKFMRNQICLYIANYFLPLDNSWNELYIEKYESSLLQVIYSTKLQSFSTNLQIALKILQGLKFISDSNICHRDIKPSNIMMNKENDPKIIDFGSSISVHNQRNIMSCNEQLCSTEGYYFPYEKCNEKIKQMFTKKQYEAHPLFDMYSFGEIMERMFEAEMTEKGNNRVIHDTLTFIILRCKQHNPDNRLIYDEAMCLLLVLRKTLDVEAKTKAVQQL